MDVEIIMALSLDSVQCLFCAIVHVINLPPEVLHAETAVHFSDRVACANEHYIADKWINHCHLANLNNKPP